MAELLSKYRTPTNDGCTQSITPENSGWDYVGFEAYELESGQTITQETQDQEVCLVLVGGHASIKTKDQDFGRLGDRMSPFERKKPVAVYVPNGDSFTVVAETKLELAVCKAPGKGNHAARVISGDQIGAEARGRGNNKRYVHNILPEDKPADSLLVVEVYTDEGNTSSYPSHKHDTDNEPNETYLEETYYHRFNPPQGFALQRVYTDDRSIDECVAPYDKDVVRAPRGYHPVATMAGYNNYYLNVMAGPIRKWCFTWETSHNWINSEEYAD